MAQVSCAINHLADLSPNRNVYELLPFNELFNGPTEKNYLAKQQIFSKKNKK